MTIFDDISRDTVSSYAALIGDQSIDQRELVTGLYDLIDALNRSNEQKAVEVHSKLLTLCYVR